MAERIPITKVARRSFADLEGTWEASLRQPERGVGGKIKEEMDFSGPMRMSDVEEVRAS